ncbi:MAG: carbon storage regulator CsrA [Planctomycetota bacterium]
MLVLTRKVGEQICIGGDIHVTVLAIHKGRVRLGVSAPRELPVHREEVHRQITNEWQPGLAGEQAQGSRSFV